MILPIWGAPSAIATKPPRHSRRGPIVSSATPLEEPDKLAGRFPLESTRLEEKPLRKQLLILASFALIINSGIAVAQQETPQQQDKSGAPSGLRANTGAPETTGQAPNFEDRWSAQRETPDRLPTATLPDSGASRTTDQAPTLDQGNGNWDPPPINAPTTQR
jgi:hypothetical protein